MVHLHDSIAYTFEEVAVVGHHQQGTAGTRKIALKELDGVDVQMVRRLVHDIEISLGREHLRQSDALDLAAG